MESGRNLAGNTVVERHMELAAFPLSIESSQRLTPRP
jgi:hypothetical protein